MRHLRVIAGHSLEQIAALANLRRAPIRWMSGGDLSVRKMLDAILRSCSPCALVKLNPQALRHTCRIAYHYFARVASISAAARVKREDEQSCSRVGTRRSGINCIGPVVRVG